MKNQSLTVIIADDEAIIRMGLKQMLASLGHRVIATAANGDEALESVTRLKPELLLLDIKMPGLDGLTVAERLAAQMPLPIVMLTAYSERGLIERAVNASVMGYLVKPIHENKLGPVIEVAIARFGAMQETAREAYRLKGQLEDRKLVDAAKQILVTTGLTEDEAYRRLQMTARRKRVSMRKVAEAVIAVGANV
jgi:AmiR/NasT family two-component response regulator